MEIVIENPTSDTSTSSVTTAGSTLIGDTTVITTNPVTPIFSTLPSNPNRPYRTAYMTNDGQLTQNVDYYRTLQAAKSSRTRNPSPEPIYNTNIPIQTSVRRVDRSGLLEIVEPEPQRTNPRNRHSTITDTGGHSSVGTLTRRIDRSGLLEAVPELPDQNWKNEDSSEALGASSREGSRENFAIERKITGAETDIHRQSSNIRRLQASPRNSREISETESRGNSSENRPTATNPSSLTTSVSSPYLRRYPGENPSSSLERPTPVIVSDDTRLRNRNSFTCVTPTNNKFLPIDALPSRSRQSYVDLTGSTYTRSPTLSISPIGSTRTNNVESSQTNFGKVENPSKQTQQQPDCLGRLSPRSKNERQSPLTMSSSIPDVIEAHGSRSHMRDTVMEKSPEGERVEAEGCEQRTNIDDNSEESRVTFKGSKKMLHNDNIQTLRVIILSEQL